MIIGLLISILNLVIFFLFILFLLQMIFSFARVDPYHPTWGPLVRLVYQIADPILQPIRNIFPPQGGLDFSAMILLIGLYILRFFLISLF